MAKAIRFREAYAQYESIVKDIRARKFAPIYLLMGEEGYFIDRLTDMLADTILDESEKAFNQLVIYGKDVEDEGIIVNYARQMPMMGGKMVIIVKEAASLRKVDNLSHYTAAPSDSTILIIAHKGKSVDKRSALYKQVSAKGVVFESPRPYDNELAPWIATYLRATKGCAIEEKALRMVVDFMGTDIAKIAGEFDKLFTRLPEGTKTITADHIEQNIGISKDFNNFELVEAVAHKQFARAMQIADNFARNPKNHPLVVTTSTLFNHFQKLFTLNYREWQTKFKGMPVASDAELAGLIKVSPYVLGGYKQAAKLYPNKKIFLILGIIREYDMKGKGVNSGGLEQGELLREMLMKIMML
ncbi:MAG: DNA polymerase III subunit delta [Tidjanibacter sp.]|nr:DNA polymerase III subunit delta [Tidjanibacter sp.]